MKGIILAGGAGTRLYPSTLVLAKQLLPVYDKPLIYYPLSVLLLAGIREILIIATEDSLPLFQKLLGDGSRLGVSFHYLAQAEPNGLAQAFVIGEQFIGSDSVCLVLGDNIFYGHGFSEVLQRTAQMRDGATIFGYYVKDPQRYGVVEFDSAGQLVGIEEKPAEAKSNYAVVGLYFYDNSVIALAKMLRPSARGEFEITDLNLEYLKRGQLQLELLGRGYAWLDTGTPDSLADATAYIKTVEDRQGLKIACIEEIALRMGFIDLPHFLELARELRSSAYGEYLLKIVGQFQHGV